MPLHTWYGVNFTDMTCFHHVNPITFPPFLTFPYFSIFLTTVKLKLFSPLGLRWGSARAAQTQHPKKVESSATRWAIVVFYCKFTVCILFDNLFQKDSDIVSDIFKIETFYFPFTKHRPSINPPFLTLWWGSTLSFYRRIWEHRWNMMNCAFQNEKHSYKMQCWVWNPTQWQGT